MSERTVQELHTEAMALAHDALIMNLKAAGLESAAAHRIEMHEDNEPTRSILYRSAAELMLAGGAPGDAESLAKGGLCGYPPPSVKAELNDVLRRAREAKERR